MIRLQKDFGPMLVGGAIVMIFFVFVGCGGGNGGNGSNIPDGSSIPSGLTATAVSSTQIDLSWTDNSSNEDGFKIERKIGTVGTYSLISTTLANVVSYSDTGLSAGTAYYYRVYAYNSTGSSGYSNEADVNTSVPPDSWTATGTGANVPSARFYHTAVWTGSEMIIWGGQYIYTVINEYGYHEGITQYIFNDGGRYNPATDSWTATSPGTNVPSARYGHTAVWTGTEMIIWGGNDGNYFNIGGRYNPSTDAWSPTTDDENEFEVRMSHTAVWTGTEMIVWGGFDYMNDTGSQSSGRYNPLTDSWTEINTDGDMPEFEYSHTAVWTGTEMIIWGGCGATSEYFSNTGGKYNPSTDSWTATSMGANVPTPRCHHTAVWTGNEMIIWGGDNHDGFCNTGGRYNPATNTWTATSIELNTPEGRAFHTAVWTGTEMIVWGGYDDHNYLTTGGKYNPSTNSWTATSIDGDVPEGRFWHTAVWTGTKMIVWGGQSESGVLNTGRIYNP
ncbi:MAG: fibronectin type III domain-containing protein [bacterium]|nr:fibronectin type III domain-containing protein [bacterium]